MNNNTTDNFWNDDLVKEYTHDVIIKALNERTVSPRTWDEQILKFKQSKQSKKQGMGKPTYKLLKDLPYAKAGDPIFYSKKGDLYFCISNVNERKYFRKEIVENSKGWFQLQQPKEEQGVKVLGFFLSSPPHKETVYCLHLNQLIHHEKYEAVKKAISDCLNEDHPKEKLDNPFFGMGYSFFNHPNSISITKEQLDVMMENVWNAAREFTGGTAQNTFYDIASQLKYKTFQDYQQSLPENKPETQTTSNASIKCQNEEKKVLFTTEEGFEVTDGEQTLLYVSQFKIREREAKNMVHIDNKRFCRRDAAEQYILDNKPCISYKEIETWVKLPYPPHMDTDDRLKRIKELVNQKLKQ